MIPPNKLAALSGGVRRRKLALCFGALERDIAGIAEIGNEYAESMPRSEYVRALVTVFLSDNALNETAKKELTDLLAQDPLNERLICNCARNHLLKIIGTLPAEWDLVIAPHKAPKNNNGEILQRTFFKGLSVYAEDIRSPFNLGSIFRTAEAMGLEKVFISPNCTDPTHPRCVRSAMGCTDSIPWQRTELANLPNVPIFVLETGGIPINDFVFPLNGIVVIGSEELGVSPQALKTATYGRVTIPMKGIKASLNVGVAFGILVQKWIESIEKVKSQ